MHEDSHQGKSYACQVYYNNHNSLNSCKVLLVNHSYGVLKYLKSNIAETVNKIYPLLTSLILFHLSNVAKCTG